MSPQRQHVGSDQVDAWLAQAKAGNLSWPELAERILQLEYPNQTQDHPDRDRQRRCGFGEVIFGSGKSVDTICTIASDLLNSGQTEVLVTRVEQSQFELLESQFPHCRYSAAGRTLRISREPVATVRQLPYPAAAPMQASGIVESNQLGQIAVITAGSTDSPIGDEALETLHWMGVRAHLITDVGVAGPYRLLAHLERLRGCAAIVVVAGMEGALASVVGGLVPCPIIAVPTSVGYGANFEGITTLLSMISSCAAGVTVVNIDAGFKGGYVAGLIANKVVQQVQPGGG